jgi:hypothetical protein
MHFDMKMILKDGLPKMAYSGYVDTAGTRSEMETYYTDGYMYYNTGGQKYKIPMNFGEASQQVGSYNYSIDGLYMIKDIQKTDKDGKASYIINYANPNFSSTMDSALSGLSSLVDPESGVSISDIKVDGFSYSIATGEDGLLAGIDIDASMSLVISAEGESMPVSYKFKIAIDVVSIGKDIEITFPSDLDSYGQFS